MAGDLRVLFLMLADDTGPLMLLVTDPVHPYDIRIVGLHAEDGDSTALLKSGDAAFDWVEAVVDDLGIEVLADMVASFPAPDVHGIDSGMLDDWAAVAFATVIATGKLLIP